MGHKNDRMSCLAAVEDAGKWWYDRMNGGKNEPLTLDESTRWAADVPSELRAARGGKQSRAASSAAPGRGGRKPGGYRDY